MATPAPPSTSAAARLQAQVIAKARQDPIAFIEYAMKDERTGAPVVCPPMHVEWHRLIDQHPRLVLHAHVEAAKTNSITIGRTLWEIGRDPSIRVALISDTSTQAAKMLASISRYIQTSAEVAATFPKLKPDRSAPWTSTAITVQRPTISKDASVQALGVGSAILGARLDLVIADDLISFDNSRTIEGRKKLCDWFDSTVLGRVTERGRVIIAGTAWSREDLMHVIAARPGWHYVRYAIEDETGKPRWAARWPKARIADKRQELGSIEASRQLDCLCRSDASATFRYEDVLAACERGANRPLLQSWNPSAAVDIVVGVDLASSKRATADSSSIAVVAVHRNGDRELVNLLVGKWDAGEILQRIVDVSRAYWPNLVVCEGNGPQMYVSQLLRSSSSVPVKAFITGRGKWSLEWQSRLLSNEISNRKWIIRQPRHPEVTKLVSEIVYYVPTEHTGDRLASLLMARYGAELGGIRAEAIVGLDMNRR